MNVLAWLHYVVALIYPAAMPDSTSSPQSEQRSRVVQIERVITNAQGDSIVQHVIKEDKPDVSYIEVGQPTSQGDDIVGLLIPLAFIGTGGLVLWKKIDSNRQLKLAMINKGMDPSTLVAQDTTKKYGALRFGMLLVGISTGLIAGLLITSLFSVDASNQDIVEISSAVFFAGLSLIIYHLIAASLNKVR